MRRVMVVVDNKDSQFFDGDNIDVIDGDYDRSSSLTGSTKLVVRQANSKGGRPITIAVFITWKYWRYLDIPEQKKA